MGEEVGTQGEEYWPRSQNQLVADWGLECMLEPWTTAAFRYPCINTVYLQKGHVHIVGG